MKKASKLGSLLLAMAMVAVLVMCENDTEDTPPGNQNNSNTYEVTFASNFPSGVDTGEWRKAGDPIEVPEGKSIADTGEMIVSPRAADGSTWKFVEWNTQANGSGEIFNKNTLVESDITVYAQWRDEYVPPSPTGSYNVTFNAYANGGTVSGQSSVTIPVDQGGTVGAASFPAAVHSNGRFNGWFTAAGGGTEFYNYTPVNSNIEVYAQFTANYTVTFNANGGTLIGVGSISVQSGESAGLQWPQNPMPPTAGQTFTGWNTQANGTGQTYGATTPITDNTNLYAQYSGGGIPTPTTYTVTFNPNGGTLNGSPAVTVQSGQSIQSAGQTLPSASKGADTFDNWWTDPNGGTQFTGGTPVTGNIIVYAHWTPGIVTPTGFIITFNGNGGTPPSQTVTLDEGVTMVGAKMPPDPTAPIGKDFSGWTTQASGGQLFTAATTVTQNVTVWAQYANSPIVADGWSIAIIQIPAQAASIHFHTGGVEDPSGSSARIQSIYMVNSQTATAGGAKLFDLSMEQASSWPTEGSSPALPAEGGMYWANNDVRSRVQNAGTADGAIFLNKPGGGDWVSAGGIGFSAPGGYFRIKYKYEGHGVRFTFSVAGSDLVMRPPGEYYFDTMTDLSGGGGGGTYTVTFNANGGQPATQTKTVQSPATIIDFLPQEPTNGDRTFDGWFTAQTGGTPFTASTAVTGSITVWAHWSGGTVVDGPWTKTQGPIILAHFMPWHYGPEYRDQENNTYYQHWDDPYRLNPLTGPYQGRSRHLLQYQLGLMKLAGIDGVIICWYGRFDIWDFGSNQEVAWAMVNMVDESKSKFAIMLEDWPTNTEAAGMGYNSRGNVEFLRDNWFNRQGYVKVPGNRPLLYCFGPQGDLRGEGYGNDVMNVANPRPYFVELVQCWNNPNFNFSVSYSDSAYNWFGLHNDNRVYSYQETAAFLDNFYGSPKYANSSFKTATIFSAFEDAYVPGIQYGRIEYNNGAIFRLTWDKAAAANPDVIQIATWNDYGEGTVVEPTWERSYNELEFLQARMRELDPTFPYTAEDLRYPLELYKLVYNRTRSANDGDINAAYSALWEGNAALFRQRCQALGL